jgi:primase-polymerase (primpol)-like protein
MTALKDFADVRRWVAWRHELRAGKPTKVPFADPKRKARTDDPKTWRVRRDAEACARQLVNGVGGGIGIVLGDLGNGRVLIGVDLDTCRDAAGNFEPWAVEVIERFGSYSEISPSGSGAKIFALAEEATVAGVRAATWYQARPHLRAPEWRHGASAGGRIAPVEPVFCHHGAAHRERAP